MSTITANQTIYEKEHATKHFYKVWFSNGSERTAKLIVDTFSHPIGKTGVSEYSRLFPISEAPKMKRCLIGNRYETWQEAFESERS